MCRDKAENAVHPKNTYLADVFINEAPLRINVTKWGSLYRSGTAKTGLGFTSTDWCDNHVQMDKKRGTSGLLSLEYELDGRVVKIGDLEVSAYAQTPKKSPDPDNYDTLLMDFVSRIKLEKASNNEYILHLEFEPGLFQLSGVNNSAEIKSYFYPRFVSSDNGLTWKFDSTHY